jgi:hypothetical protein
MDKKTGKTGPLTGLIHRKPRRTSKHDQQILAEKD